MGVQYDACTKTMTMEIVETTGGSSHLMQADHCQQPPRAVKNYNLFRCDRVQTPPPGPFNSDVLEWFPNLKAVEAFIPLGRLQDWFNGEETREGLRCRFRITKTTSEDRPDQIGKTTKRYHCCYGPTDLRFVELPPVPKSRTLEDGGRPLARSTKLRTSLQRGCTAHFAIVFLDDRPDAVLIRWFERKHVDVSAAPCHGTSDKRALNASAPPKRKYERRASNQVAQSDTDRKQVPPKSKYQRKASNNAPESDTQPKGLPTKCKYQRKTISKAPACGKENIAPMPQ